LQETEDYDLFDTYNAEETGLFLNLQPTKPSLFGETFAMVVYNVNSRLLYSSRAMLMVVINCHLL
jgi:hypothetical protein